MDTNIITNSKKSSVSFTGQTVYLGLDVYKKTGVLLCILGLHFLRPFIRSQNR